MKQRIKHFYKHAHKTSSFQKRLVLSFFFVAVPVLIIISIGLYVFLGSSARENTLKTMLQTLEQVDAQLENIIDDTENLSRNIIYDSDIQSFLDEAASGEAYPDPEAVRYFVNGFIVNRDYMESIVITGPSDTLFSTEKAYTDVSSFSNIQKKWWYTNLLNTNEPYIWYPSAKGSSNNLEENQSLMMTRIIKSTKDYTTPIGRMMIYIKEDYVSDILNNISWGDTLRAWVLDGNGQMMLKNNFASVSLPETVINFTLSTSDDSDLLHINGQNFVVGHKRINDDGWQLILSVPFTEVDDNGNILFLQIAAMLAMVIITVSLVSMTVSRALSRPIRQIADVMDSYHNPSDDNSNVPETASRNALAAISNLSKRPDEVGTISRSYEKMVARVDTLIKEIYVKDLEKKEAELALLQSQINPHFLYNTLDSINWLAMANGQDEISEMVTALSDTFRLSLRRTNSPYTQIHQEIEYLSSYLTLQKYRLGERLHYHFHISETVETLYVLRFILQPLIENSIKHGISHLENGGNIDISMNISENTRGRFLEIHVINDGADIDPEHINGLLAFDARTQTFLSFKHDSYGLQNINRRIKIVHGSDFGIRFSITKDARTDCMVLLPVIEKELKSIDVLF